MLAHRLLFLSALWMISIGAAQAQSDGTAAVDAAAPTPAARVETCLSEAD